MKILILKFRNIGDVLLATPLVNNLKKNYPEASIDFALNKNCIDMMSLNPNIENILVYDRDKIKKLPLLEKIKSEWQFGSQVRRLHYDLVINLTEGDRGALLALMSGAKERIGIIPKNFLLALLKPFTSHISAIPYEHTVEKDLFPLHLLAKQALSKEVGIYWDSETESRVNQLLKNQNVDRFIHIHPVARWFFKCWDDKKFAKVIDYLQLEKNTTVVITAAPDEKEMQRVDKIINYCESFPINLSAQLSLKEVAYLSSRADLFLGVDTAPMHMAAAVNTPVIALFGNSLAYIWGPWDNALMCSNFKDDLLTQKNGQHLIIQKPGDDEITYIQGEKLSTAMMRIEVEDVIPLIHDACVKLSCD